MKKLILTLLGVIISLALSAQHYRVIKIAYGKLTDTSLTTVKHVVPFATYFNIYEDRMSITNRESSRRFYNFVDYLADTADIYITESWFATDNRGAAYVVVIKRELGVDCMSLGLFPFASETYTEYVLVKMPNKTERKKNAKSKRTTKRKPTGS